MLQTHYAPDSRHSRRRIRYRLVSAQVTNKRSDWASLSCERLAKENYALSFSEPEGTVNYLACMIIKRHIRCELAAADAHAPLGHRRHQ